MQFFLRTARCLPLLLIPLLAGAENASSIPPSAAPILIGGKTLVFPEPEGFVRVDGKDPDKDRLIAISLPKTNRYLARYEPAPAAVAGASKLPQRRFNAQTLINLEDQDVGERTFAESKQQMKKEIEDMDEEIQKSISRVSEQTGKALSEEIGTEAKLDLSDLVVLGNFDDSPSSLGFSVALNVKVSVNGRVEKSKQITSAIMLPVNGRMVLLYSLSEFGSEADRNWTESSVSKWRDAILAANPRVQGPPAGRSAFSFYRLGRSAGIGGAVGAVIGLFYWQVKKRRAA